MICVIEKITLKLLIHKFLGNKYLDSINCKKILVSKYLILKCMRNLQLYLLYRQTRLYKAFNSPAVPPSATHFLCTNKTYRERWIEYRHQKALVSDRADPVTTCWLMLTVALLRNRGDSHVAIETALYSFAKSILTHYCEKWWWYLVISHSPTRLYRQIIYTSKSSIYQRW